MELGSNKHFSDDFFINIRILIKILGGQLKTPVNLGCVFSGINKQLGVKNLLPLRLIPG